MCGVMIWEMISQNQAQGTPIAIKPNFNYMVRPARIRFLCWHVLFIQAAESSADMCCLSDFGVIDRTELRCPDQRRSEVRAMH